MQRKVLVRQLGFNLGVLLLGGALSARAQATPPIEATVAATTIRLAQMAGGGGDAAIVRAIQRGVKYPRQALRDGAQGQNMVTFAVSPSGQVCLLNIKYSLRADLDSAVVQAVRRLPRLQPATQHGQPAACQMSAPVTFTISNPARLPRQPQPALDSTQVYTAVTRMPTYRGEPGFAQLSADLTAEYTRLSQGAACAVPRYGRTFVATLGPSGTLYHVQLASDAAELATLESQFKGQVLQAEADEADELSEACVALVAEAARHLPRLTPAYVAGRPVAMRLLLSLSNPRP